MIQPITDNFSLGQNLRKFDTAQAKKTSQLPQAPTPNSPRGIKDWSSKLARFK